MNKLRHFIDTNRKAFEDDLPPEGHFERFERKLDARRKSRSILHSLYILAAAACIALLFLIKPSDDTLVHTLPESHKCEMQEEIDGLRFYYSMQMSDIFLQMQAISKQRQIPGADEILEETMCS